MIAGKCLYGINRVDLDDISFVVLLNIFKRLQSFKWWNLEVGFDSLCSGYIESYSTRLAQNKAVSLSEGKRQAVTEETQLFHSFTNRDTLILP